MGVLFFLSSGLFLGWSLGANDASNIFGTSVATNMIKFRTAALICSVFVILGACISGAGASYTLGKLGAVNELAGSFMVACAAGLTVLWMTRLELPVSTSQAIVGGIIGWNFFSGSLTDFSSLAKIVTTWVLCPVLAAVFSIIFYKLLQMLLRIAKLHLFRLDAYTRTGLIMVGAFGAYSLGANNIANVMGVFVPVAPFQTIDVFGLFQFDGTQQLFLIGGLAIATGVFTYSYKVMDTVGQKLVKLTPQAALIVILAESTVLFLFASQGLEAWLIAHGLPTIPLVPVSSSQAVIGAVIGIGLAKGSRHIQWKVLGSIAAGWLTTPILAGVLSFVSLFFLQNVFNQRVYRPVPYCLSTAVRQRLLQTEVPSTELNKLANITWRNARTFLRTLRRKTHLNTQQQRTVLRFAEVDPLKIDPLVLERKLDLRLFTPSQYRALRALRGRSFKHKWQLQDALQQQSEQWRLRPDTPRNRNFNRQLRNRLQYLYRALRTSCH